MIAVKRFASAIRETKGAIHLDQRRTEEIDLCAAAVVNALALEVRDDGRRGFTGRYPDSAEAHEIVAATGLPRCLNLTDESPRFLTFELTGGRDRYYGGLESSEVDELAPALVQYLDGCLARYNLSLSQEGQELFVALIGEVLDNAGAHSGGGRWFVTGYMRQPAGADVGDVHLVIFNTGHSIAESLKTLPPDARLRRDIEALVQRQRNTGGLGPKTPEEVVWTICALQEKVSRKNDHPEIVGHQGVGTIDLLEAFTKLGGSSRPGQRPRMCIYSGHVHLLFDGTYRLARQRNREGDTHRIIAFNRQNDLGRPPDPAFVRYLAVPFPGTMISVRFFVDRQYLLGAGEAI